MISITLKHKYEMYIMKIVKKERIKRLLLLLLLLLSVTVCIDLRTVRKCYIQTLLC